MEPKPETILVVDDNEANRALAEAALSDEGYRVLLAVDGAAGIAAFERDRPDCVLLDVRMPGLDGIQACQAIRALPGGAETPILFVTALRDVDTFDQALAAGGDDFLTKPIRPAELLARVASVLQLRRLRAERREHYELLKRQRDDLQRAQLQKERLMAFVVHDLKNPVNAVDLRAQLLLRDASLSASARDSVHRIHAGARELARMISNLLDVAKADEGLLTPKRTRVDLVALVDEVSRELRVAADDRRVTLVGDVQAREIQADEDLLRRTLMNLGENAIKHAPKGTTVTITAHDVEGAIELRVADRGTGVPEGLREKIFEAYVQADPVGASGARGSRGLGLAFCRLAVEAHGGRIWVEDGAPGAVFCTRVPHER